MPKSREEVCKELARDILVELIKGDKPLKRLLVDDVRTSNDAPYTIEVDYNGYLIRFNVTYAGKKD